MLKYLRLREHLTQKELSEKLGVGETTVSMWESGNREPGHDTMELIADFFNVNMDFLHGREMLAVEPNSEQEQRLLLLYRKMSTAQREAYIAMLEASQPPK